MYYKNFLIKVASTSIFTKLVLVYVFVIFIPISLAGVYASSRFNEKMADEVYNSLFEVTNQVSKNLEFNFKEMESIVDLIRFKPDIMNILNKKYPINPYSSKDPDELWSYIEDHKNISDYIKGLMSIQNSCLEIGVYTMDGRIYRQSKLAKRYIGSKNYDFNRFEWYRRAIDNNGKRVFLGTHKQEQVEDGDDVFSITKLVKSDTGRNLAVVLVDFDFKILENICNMINFGVDQNIFIIDEFSNIVYSQKPEPIPDFKDDDLNVFLSEESSKFETTIYGEKYFVSSIKENQSGWRIVSMIPVNELASRYNFVGNLVLLVLFIVLILVTAITIITVKTIYKPIKELSEVMVSAAQGKMDVRHNFSGDNEIGKLSKSFNFMIENINELIEQEKKSQVMIRESEIKALQAQINPHFLYNTLNTVKWMAIDVNAEKIKTTINSLVHLLKNTISNKNSLITFDEEFENVKNFVQIQSTRYDKEFAIDYNLNPNVKNLMVIKLLIQPIVENAIFHGFNDFNREKAHIIVSAELIETIVKVTVKDNGVGIKKDDIDSILNKSINNNWQFTGIGVGNVNERIKLNYGNEFGVDIISEIGEGVEVTLFLPAIQKGIIKNVEDSDS